MVRREQGSQREYAIRESSVAGQAIGYHILHEVFTSHVPSLPWRVVGYLGTGDLSQVDEWGMSNARKIAARDLASRLNMEELAVICEGDKGAADRISLLFLGESSLATDFGYFCGREYLRRKDKNSPSDPVGWVDIDGMLVRFVGGAPAQVSLGIDPGPASRVRLADGVLRRVGFALRGSGAGIWEEDGPGNSSLYLLPEDTRRLEE